MNKIRKNQKGFSVVEVLMALVIVILIGVVGWMVYKNHHKTTTKSVASTKSSSVNTAKPAATAQSANPYAGWKSATLQYERIAYQYPSDWTLTDTSQAEPKSQNGCTYPGHDQVTLSSPSGTQVAINAGQDCFGDAGAQAFGSVPVTALGQSLYLVFEADVGFDSTPPTGPSDACLAPTTTPGSPFVFNSKNIFYNGDGASGNSPVNSFCYIPYNPDAYQNTSTPTFTAAQIESTKDFSTAKLILESLHY